MIWELQPPGGLRYQAPILDYPFCSSCDTCTRTQTIIQIQCTLKLGSYETALLDTVSKLRQDYSTQSRFFKLNALWARISSEPFGSAQQHLSARLIDSSQSIQRALTNLSQSTRSIQRALTDLSQLTHKPFTEQKSWTTCGFMIFPRLSPDLPQKCTSCVYVSSHACTVQNCRKLYYVW